MCVLPPRFLCNTCFLDGPSRQRQSTHPTPPSITVDWEGASRLKVTEIDFLSTGTFWHIMRQDRAETPTPTTPSRAYLVEGEKPDQAEGLDLIFIPGIRRKLGPGPDTCTHLPLAGILGRKRSAMPGRVTSTCSSIAGIFNGRRKTGPGIDLPHDLPTDPVGAEGSPP